MLLKGDRFSTSQSRFEAMKNEMRELETRLEMLKSGSSGKLFLCDIFDRHAFSLCLLMTQDKVADSNAAVGRISSIRSMVCPPILACGSPICAFPGYILAFRPRNVPIIL